MSTTAETTGRPVGALLGRRPARAAGVELLGEVGGSGYRQAPSLVRRTDGQMVQLTPLLFQLLDAVDGERDDDALASDLSERTGKHVTAEDVRFLIEERLRPLGLLRQPDGSEPAVLKINPLLALRLKLVVSNPATTRLLAAPFAPLFRPAVVVPFVVAFVLTTWWVAFEQGLASAARQALYQPELLLLVFALTWLSAGFHELGHAAACRYGGARPGAMGMGLYLVWPAFYTDVTDSYRLRRGGRLRVDLGGLYFNMIFGVGVFVAWTFLHWDALLLVIAAQLLQMLRQLVPFVRFDGYHVLADLTGVPDLFHHIKPTLLGLVPGRRDGRAPLKTWARAVVTVWVVAVVPLLLGVLVFIVIVMPRIVATAWDSLGLRSGELTASWGEVDVAGVAYSVLRIVMICLPVGGIAYVLVRVLRRVVRTVWHRTAGRPLLRAAAALTGAALLAGLAWAWWPDDERYRPIDAGDRWRLAEPPPAPLPQPLAATAPTAAVTPPAPVPPRLRRTAAPAPAGHHEWRPVLVAQTARALPEPGEPPAPVTVIVPTEPPASEPVPGTTSGPATTPAQSVAPTEQPEPPAAPASEAESSSWVFPWAPPREPVEGDNQVVSINTEDGSTDYDIALALVWVADGERVEQRNEAYAFASCTDCRTGAVAFQVILIVGYNGIITPVNAAVAANYRCDSCVTQAVAVQLIATLTRQPDAETIGELNGIWAALERRSESFESMPVEQVYATLLAAESLILEALAADDASVERAGTTKTSSTSPSPSPSPTEVTPPTETTTAPPPAKTTTTASSETVPAPSDTEEATTSELTDDAAEDVAAAESADDETCEPAEDAIAETTTEPTDETTTEPAQETTTEPADETITEPTDDASADPAANAACEPADESTGEQGEPATGG